MDRNFNTGFYEYYTNTYSDSLDTQRYTL
ncbi:CIC11C00000000225 (mitochondrion) [Sungouiella intermedia]|uniref:CIC11C00000000225 n=1 Tax=Sungouiella intermedia TaxID=45354 RepID=A0A1L0C606_9ASCO|nr:CIC11C00000000225 [[Candida] intermedia]